MKEIDLAKLSADAPVIELKSRLKPLALAYLLARHNGTVPSELEEKLNAIRDKVKELDPKSAVLRETAELVQ